ncbi:autotransporter outer membrane beta-barrel domain-containing protein, partial [Uliginosibacterium sp. sgz301328]
MSQNSGDITSASGAGIHASNGSAASDVTVVQNAGTIVGATNGIDAENAGTGATSVSVAGDVAGTNLAGVYAYNGRTATNLTVTQTGGTITSDQDDGIRADNLGTGSTTVDVAGVIKAAEAGVTAYNGATTTDLTVVQRGGTIISAQNNGISVQNSGTGTTNVTVAGDVTGMMSGVYAANDSRATDLTVVQSSGTITAGSFETGIVAYNWGTGTTSVSAAGNINAGMYGIDAYNGASATDLTITQGAGGIIGSYRGISAQNEGAGATNVSAAGDVTGRMDTGIYARNGVNSSNLIIEQTGGTITGNIYGINASNSGTGATSINVAGDVTGLNNTGIYAVNGSTTTDLTITQSAGTISGNKGIHAYNEGTGATTINIAGDVIAEYADGIYVVNTQNATDLTVTQYGGTISGKTGIDVINDGSGATNISVSGDVTGKADYGVYASLSSSASDLTMVQSDGSIAGKKSGIFAHNLGHGATRISAAGDVTSTDANGIFATNGQESTDLVVTQTEGTISGFATGIMAVNGGAGATSIDVAGDVSGQNDAGITAMNSGSATSLTITQGSGTISGGSGIYATNNGTGATNIRVASNVTGNGINGSGIYAQNGAATTDLTVTQSGGSITGSGFGIYAENGGAGLTNVTVAGDITATSGTGITAYSNDASTGLLVTQSAGTITSNNYGIWTYNAGIGATSIDTAGDIGSRYGDGISAYSGNSSTDLTVTQSAGSISGTTGIVVNNGGTGATSVDVAGNVTGTYSYGINAMGGSETTDLTVTQSGGTIAGTTSGILAYNLGTGATYISTAGDVSGDGFAGIEASSGSTTTGMTVAQSGGTVIGSYNGIQAVNYGTGTTDVIIKGDVTGTYGNGIVVVGDTFTKDLTLTQSAGAIVGGMSGIEVANGGAGSTTVEVAGTVVGGTEAGISTGTLAGASVAIALLDGADVSAASGTAIRDTDGNAIVTMESGSKLRGAVRLGNGDDSITIEGNADISGVTYLDGGNADDSNVTDILGTSGAGTNKLTFLDTTQTVTGANLLNWQTVTVDGSAVTLADGTLTTGTGSNPDDSLQGLVLTNASTLISPATLAVTGDVAINAGSTLQHAQGGTITGAVTNAGTIAWDWSDAGHKLTIDGDYTGNNGLLVMNTQLGADDSPTDTLAITGAVSGSTRVAVNNAGGLGAMTTGNGIPLIDAANASTDAFTQQGRISAGAYDYTLYAGGRDGSYVGDWYLRSTYEPEDVTPPSPGEPTPGEVTPPTPSEPTPELPNYRDEVAVANVVPALANRMGLAMLGTYHDRIGEGVPGQQEWNGWARAFGETGKTGRGGNDPQGRLSNFQKEGASYDYDMAGVQAGIDMLRAKNDVAGWYAGFGRIDADVEGVYGGRAGSTSMDVHSLGGYWTHRADAGWYVDSVVQGSWYQRIRAKSMAGETLRLDGNGLTAS